MKAPTDAQARVLQMVEQPPRGADVLLWQPDPAVQHWATLAVLLVDRENDTARFSYAWEWDHIPYRHRRVLCATMNVLKREGWIDTTHETSVEMSDGSTRTFTEVRLDDDGIIALGLWRERKLNAPPADIPKLTDREREVAELAQRALELGYALCPRKPAREEARRLRRAGWFASCWIANNAQGLVPTPMAVVEIRPESADVA